MVQYPGLNGRLYSRDRLGASAGLRKPRGVFGPAEVIPKTYTHYPSSHKHQAPVGGVTGISIGGTPGAVLPGGRVLFPAPPRNKQAVRKKVHLWSLNSPIVVPCNCLQNNVVPSPFWINQACKRLCCTRHRLQECSGISLRLMITGLSEDWRCSVPLSRASGSRMCCCCSFRHTDGRIRIIRRARMQQLGTKPRPARRMRRIWRIDMGGSAVFQARYAFGLV